ncbi:response regulator [Parvularcula lutaonensis]|uniref:Response regulator n=1 Tax=Parvularcula lutaonensis TaxID=491923 RepID=A0ABV7MDA2_9PROT|nr:response regulator [Parvularcula lutaonensis]GGY50870.1 response regulator [Parvularcula lutaonensis]
MGIQLIRGIIASGPASLDYLLSAGSPASAGSRPGTGDDKDGSALSGKRILVAEDEIIVGLEMQHALENASADVIGPAGSLSEALNILATEEIDGAILDLDLHGEEVFPAADILQSRGVPFLFHTGHGERAEILRRYNRSAVCVKPCLPEDLLAQLARLMAN